MNTYFDKQYKNLKFVKATDTSPGLRNAQIGAIHAISSYFTIPRNKAAIIVMPTGERVIIVIGCINALVSRVSGTFTQKFSCIA